MVPIGDSYFREALKKYLSAILTSAGDGTSKYNIEMILQTIEPNLAKEFIDAYGKFLPKSKDISTRKISLSDYKSAKDIDITYAYNKNRQNADALYVIERGPVTQDNDDGSIGNQVGSVDQVGGQRPGVNLTNETLVIQNDERGRYVETKYPVGAISNIPNMTNNNIDFEHTEKGSHIIRLMSEYIPEALVGQAIDISYVIADEGIHKDDAIQPLGQTYTENVMITSVSNNINTVRCLDTLLKTIVILIFNDNISLRYYQNPSYSSDGIGILDESKGFDNPVYCIPSTITYKATYSMPKYFTTKLKAINTIVKGDSDGKKHSS